ncbi:MAG: GNAT family N-acetyltransferase [Bacteroidota bacterium]
MISLLRTNSNDKDFKSLVESLDAELRSLDGDDHVFYGQLNKTDDVDCVIAYIDNSAVGCGAIRKFSDESMEIKRMYTREEIRGKGVATAIVADLENWSRELGYSSCVLETGKRQPWAIALYKKLGYKEIPNYGKYAGVLNSVCFEKKLA